VDTALLNKLADAREMLINSVVEILKAYRRELFSATQMTGELVCSESLKYLPLFVLALLKNIAFRLSATTLDERAYVIYLPFFFPLV
jgi:protein transport protein SEC24